MYRRLWSWLAMAALAAAIVSLAGSALIEKSASDLGNVDLDATVPFTGIEPIQLKVRFKAQVPPGSWARTGNCNPACFAMIQAHLAQSEPTAALIRAFDDWAQREFGLEHNGYNGRAKGYTNTQMEQYASSLGWNGARAAQGNLPLLITLLKRGIPIVVSVKRRMDSCMPTRHAMLVVGIDPQSIIVHDPGRAAGQYNRYPLEQFLNVWRTGGNRMFYVEPDLTV